VRVHAQLMAEAHKGSSIGRKGNQPAWFREAAHVRGSQTHPERTSTWEPYEGDPLRAKHVATAQQSGRAGAALCWGTCA
jgi:hypothetical protein